MSILCAIPDIFSEATDGTLSQCTINEQLDQEMRDLAKAANGNALLYTQGLDKYQHDIEDLQTAAKNEGHGLANFSLLGILPNIDPTSASFKGGFLLAAAAVIAFIAWKHFGGKA